MVALYDYDPRESSPNVDVEVRGRATDVSAHEDEMTIWLLHFCVSRQAELTFCAGDIIAVFGEIDEDGFYYVSKAVF